ncbi:hypothetical protein [Nitrincola iocasae]|uniref:Flagellar protein FliT n=1 Tax=Nitrincola iocasae TaxID=2614693 RepID=A0A5J6LHF9_9GAMM|nr:hypothetical protein [Nitrincola iocasae]QEW07742.1 hypothetical protein F5I99_15260 [Nitrincola iocasae]
MKPLAQLAQELCQLTDAAVNCCKNEDWQKLELYQEQRAVVLQQLRELVEQQPRLDEQTAAEFQEAMLSTRAADQMIQARVKQVRQILLDENSDLLKTRKASRVYQQND